MKAGVCGTVCSVYNVRYCDLDALAFQSLSLKKSKQQIGKRAGTCIDHGKHEGADNVPSHAADLQAIRAAVLTARRRASLQERAPKGMSKL